MVHVAFRAVQPLMMLVCMSLTVFACNSIQGMTAPIPRVRAITHTLISCASPCVFCPAVGYEVREIDEASNLPMVACIVLQFLFVLVQRLRFLHEADTLPDSDADSERLKQGRQWRQAQLQDVYSAQKENVKEQIGAAMLPAMQPTISAGQRDTAGVAHVLQIVQC